MVKYAYQRTSKSKLDLKRTFKISMYRISLVVQWLRLCSFNAGGLGSLLGQGTKIPNTREQLSLYRCSKDPTTAK